MMDSKPKTDNKVNVGRGGKVDVSGLSGKNAVKALETANKLLGNGITYNLLLDQPRLNALGNELRAYVKDLDLGYKIDSGCFAKLGKAIELVKSNRETDVLRGLKILDDFTIIANDYFGKYGEGDRYLVSKKAEMELKEVMSEIYAKRELITEKANKILERIGWEPIDCNSWIPDDRNEFELARQTQNKTQLGIVTTAASIMVILHSAINEAR